MKEIYYSVEWKANPARQHLFGWGRIFVYLNSDDVDLVKSNISSTIINNIKHSFPNWDLLVMADEPKYLHLRLSNRGTGMAGGAMREHTKDVAREVKNLVKTLIKRMGFKPVLGE
jgi:ribose 1,5-bisphosphokinase PhnN